MPLHNSLTTTLQDLVIWLLPGLTDRKLQKLIPELGYEPRPLLEAAYRLPGLPAKTRDLIQIALHDPWQLPFAKQLEAHLCWAEAENHWLLPLRELPELLQQLPDPPYLLSVQGRPEVLQGPSLAVVGSRRLSPEGRSLAYHWSHWLAWQGLNLVSGLARGVDGQAHQGALKAREEGATGCTLAVLAHGMDSLYPPEHQNLAARLLDQGGALVSEYSLGNRPLARQFPKRNRIITGLSLGTLVVEATLRSGSLVSARLAMEQGREVMAVPGSVRREQSQGCHQLIRQGAALVTCPEEVLQEIQQPLQFQLEKESQANPQSVQIPEKLQSIYCLLTDVPQSMDELLLQAQLDAATGMLLLQELELEGLAEQQPGGWCLST
ncbi:DNA-processing protein DprA [Marinospirillum sp.]|uniref:DNA-processing protein DprA n=1 Tax=Marinospirillum sp. TaxID=2183934 RepID=UPI0028705586|nr:DNA-processing protein DprA [Marinospirillum sp.]MDR9468551.1 DNA-processing protein DprA [Marinospirillum sp.]